MSQSISQDSEKKLAVDFLKPEKITISEARKNLSKLIHLLEGKPNRIFELDRRDTPSALLLSCEFSSVINAFQAGDLKALLAKLVLNKWFGSENIPPHLSKPQLQELDAMELPQLLILFQADPSTPLESLMKMGNLNEGLVTRLIKRRKITEAIIEAEKNELYDISEYLSGAS